MEGDLKNGRKAKSTLPSFYKGEINPPLAKGKSIKIPPLAKGGLRGI